MVLLSERGKKQCPNSPNGQLYFKFKTKPVGGRHRHKTKTHTNIIHPKLGLMNLTVLAPNFSFSFSRVGAGGTRGDFNRPTAWLL
jgi:hypothetical protein